MKINHRHYILILFAIITVVVVCIGYYFIYNKTIIQAESYVHANQEVDIEAHKKQTDQELQKMFDATKSSRAKLSSFLVHENTLVTFIEMVENVGEQTGTKLELSSLTTESDMVKARVTVSGSWTGVISALMLIENLPVNLSINDIHLDTVDTKGIRSWSMSFALQAVTIK